MKSIIYEKWFGILMIFITVGVVLIFAGLGILSNEYESSNPVTIEPVQSYNPKNNMACIMSEKFIKDELVFNELEFANDCLDVDYLGDKTYQVWSHVDAIVYGIKLRYDYYVEIVDQGNYYWTLNDLIIE